MQYPEKSVVFLYSLEIREGHLYTTDVQADKMASFQCNLPLLNSAVSEVHCNIFERPLFPPMEAPSRQFKAPVLLWWSMLDHKVFAKSYYYLSLFFMPYLFFVPTSPQIFSSFLCDRKDAYSSTFLTTTNLHCAVMFK